MYSDNYFSDFDKQGKCLLDWATLTTRPEHQKM